MRVERRSSDQATSTAKALSSPRSAPRRPLATSSHSRRSRHVDTCSFHFGTADGVFVRDVGIIPTDHAVLAVLAWEAFKPPGPNDDLGAQPVHKLEGRHLFRKALEAFLIGRTDGIDVCAWEKDGRRKK